VNKFEITTLQRYVVDFISATDIGYEYICFTVILGIFAHMKYVLFPHSSCFIPIFMKFPFEWDCYGISHSHALTSRLSDRHVNYTPT